MILLVATLIGALAAPAEPPERDRPGAVMPDRDWDFVHLDLEVRLDLERGTVHGVARHEVRPLGRPSASVRLHQVGLEIEAVTVDGAPVEAWRLGPDTLDIPVSPDGDAHVVEVRYHAQPQSGMHFRGVRGLDPVREVWTQGEPEENRYWVPLWDYPNDKMTVATDVIVPDGIVAFSNGELVGTEPAGDGWTRWSYRLDRPIVGYLLAITAGAYGTFDDDGPVPLTYVVPASAGEEAARRSLGVVAEQMPWMAELLDEPFPYPVYRQVFVSRYLYGGMENATLTVLSDELLLGHPSVRDRRTEEVVAHELAHQWFGDLLTCYGWRELWLNEGFASFYTARWLEHRYGPDRYAAKVRNWLRWAQGPAAPMAARSWSKVGDRENAAVYVRGAAVLHMLRVYLGGEVFDRAIARYVDENTDRLVESEDLRRVLEDESGTHLGWLFDSWVFGVGVPSVETRWSWADGALEVVLAQTTEGAPFSAPVVIEVGLAEDVRERRVWLGPGETRLVLELDQAPRWVAVDAPGGVLASWSHDQSPESWAAQALHSPTPHARLVALEQLGEGKATAPAVAALRTVLQDGGRDRTPREVAAASLGKLGTTDALEALALAVDDEVPEVRQAVVEALGAAPPPASRVADQLARRASTDADPFVRAEALGALAKVSPERAASLARQRIGRTDVTPDGSEHVAAWRVLGEHGDPGDLNQALRRLDRGPRDARHAAARAAVARFTDLEERQQERRRLELVSALLPVLDSADLRDQQLAIALLGRVGEDGAEAALTAYARGNLVREPDLSSAALDAAHLIRSRGAEAGAETPPDDLVRIRQRLEALEERLEEVERWR